MQTYKKIIFILALMVCANSYATEKPLIRLGVLAFGTVNWELKAMQQAKRLETEQYRVQILPMANPQASKIALLSGAVDMIVADWIWVSRQRGQGKDYSFYPYSNTTGALVLAKKSAIKSIQDLQGKKLAIAGGELDKNSLLLQTLLQKQGQAHAFNQIEKIYGAPPLLTEQLKRKRVDALLTYWHYAARLQAQGYPVLLTGADILHDLGINNKVASIGYVFSETWARQHPHAVNAFLNNAQATKKQLCTDKHAWQGIETLIHAENTAENQLLRQYYCAGQVVNWGQAEQQSAEKIYQHIKLLSQYRLTGKSETIQAGTFWQK